MPSTAFNVERFNELVDLSGLSYREIAKETGLTTQTVASYGNGKTDPSLSAFVAIANFLNVPMEYLVKDPTDFSVFQKRDELLNKASPNPELLHLGRSGRVYNAVCRAGIQSITELEEMLDSGEFARKRGVGQKMVDEAKKAIEMYKEIL